MTTDLNAANVAMQRAMPMTRLLDCGMDHADALQLFARTSAGEPWDQVAEVLANDRFAAAARARHAGHRNTADEFQSMGIADLMFAQMAFNQDSPRKLALYGRLRDAVQQLADGSDGRLTRKEVPFSGKHLVGWLLRPAEGAARGTVLLFGGQSGWGVAYLPLARVLARRGLATLMADGPGQGETRLMNGILLDVDVVAAYRRFIDEIVNDASLGSPGIWGNSIGGLWAATTAAADPRIRACCVNGAMASPRILPFRTYIEQAAAMLSNNDEAAILANFQRLSFRPERDRIACPLLVLHGGADPLISLEDQQPFMQGADPAKATLRIWPDGEHTIYNHAHERALIVADWFAEHLAPAAADQRF